MSHWCHHLNFQSSWLIIILLAFQNLACSIPNWRGICFINRYGIPLPETNSYYRTWKLTAWKLDPFLSGCGPPLFQLAFAVRPLGSDSACSGQKKLMAFEEKIHANHLILENHVVHHFGWRQTPSENYHGTPSDGGLVQMNCPRFRVIFRFQLVSKGVYRYEFTIKINHECIGKYTIKFKP